MEGSALRSTITNVAPSFFKNTNRDLNIWLESKRNDDNVEDGLWRNNDTLYDLSAFIDKHPGGPDWLRMTKGHDITEAFLSHHLNTEKLQTYLDKYRVRDTSHPRNVKLTFHENGFYMTLRRKVAAKLPEIKKNTKVYSKIYIDGLFILTLLTAILTQRFQSSAMALICSLFLAWTGISAHNFFHQRDNYPMLYFNLLFMNYRDWRISHCLSHHLYPNSLLDFELVSFEPILVWAPTEKNFFQRYASHIYSPFFYCLLYLLEFAKKIYYCVTLGGPMYIDDFIPFVIPFVMFTFGGSNSLASALKMFGIIIVFSGFIFGVITLNSGHFHPEVVHDGDAIRKDLDWGLYSIDTLIERQEIKGNAFLALTNFGDHALHHLFPTLDHGILPELYTIFYETMAEFQVEFQCYPWFFDTIIGQFQQLSRTETMKLDPNQRYLLRGIQK